MVKAEIETNARPAALPPWTKLVHGLSQFPFGINISLFPVDQVGSTARRIYARKAGRPTVVVRGSAAGSGRRPGPDPCIRYGRGPLHGGPGTRPETLARGEAL